MHKISRFMIALFALSIITPLTYSAAKAGSGLPNDMVKKYLSMNKLDKIKAKTMMTRYMMTTITPQQMKALKISKQSVVNVKTGKKYTAVIQFTKKKPRQVSLNNGSVTPVIALAGKKFKHNNSVYQYTRGRLQTRSLHGRRYLSLSSRARRCMRSRRCRSVVGRFIRKHAHNTRYIPTRYKRKKLAKKRRALKRRRALRKSRYNVTRYKRKLAKRRALKRHHILRKRRALHRSKYKRTSYRGRRHLRRRARR